MFLRDMTAVVVIFTTNFVVSLAYRRRILLESLPYSAVLYPTTGRNFSDLVERYSDDLLYFERRLDVS